MFVRSTLYYSCDEMSVMWGVDDRSKSVDQASVFFFFFLKERKKEKTNRHKNNKCFFSSAFFSVLLLKGKSDFNFPITNTLF